MLKRIATLFTLLATSHFAYGQTSLLPQIERGKVCEQAALQGDLLGLCRAYWEANKCDVVLTEGTKTSCTTIASRFRVLSSGLPLPGVVRVDFPAGAFASATTVTVETTQDPKTTTAFEEFTAFYFELWRLPHRTT